MFRNVDKILPSNVRLPHDTLFGSTLFTQVDIMNNFFEFHMSLTLFYLVLLFGIVFSRPLMQKILINNHEWEVPNEPGWEEVIKDVELVRERIFSSCLTVAECRQIVHEIRIVFQRHPVSRKYLNYKEDDADNILRTIFKWG